MPSPAAQFLTSSPSDLARAAELLRAGHCVALPTETVYGLAADALNPSALAQVFTIKGRPLLDPLIVHVLDQAALAEVAEPDERLALLTSFWPGPLTVVLRRKACVPDLVTASKPTVAVRIPAHPIFREVLRLSVRPLAAPSANPFGYVSPTKAAHVSDSLGKRCPWIVDGGACTHGVESTILDLSVPGRARLLRPGPITLEALQAKLGFIEVVTRAASQQSAQDAPGMLERHYSPATRVELFARGSTPAAASGKVARLLLARRSDLPAGPADFYLSEHGSAEEGARHLFDLLRQLDARGFDVIQAELAEAAGIGVAYNDRLTRAAAR
ncbi:MAG: L-threonylcarbamoyladenylate synthase [Verrucomicrobia bacterium]|nr:L-threonylcarbamoyladenylate synthase [Verrucomicrobiota bacterium]